MEIYNLKVVNSKIQINDSIQTIVGIESSLTGEINTESSIRIEGHFSGKINSQGEVFIGSKSKVKADINAMRLVVSGELEGDVEVLDSIEIFSNGRLKGNISGKKLIVNEGAIFLGKVNMNLISPGKIKEA